MSKITVISSVVLLVAGCVAAAGYTGATKGWCGHGWRHHNIPLAYMSHELNLNSTQQSQIHSIWDSEKPAIASLVRDFAAENREMENATAGTAVNQSAVQQIAQREGDTLMKLLMEKESLKSQIYAKVLTPEQRAKANQMQTHFDSHLNMLANRLAAAPGDKWQ